METEANPFETIEAAESEPVGLAVTERETPWYRDVRLIVCILALTVSAFSLAHSLIVHREDELRANRRDLKKIIQTLAEMRLTNARDMALVSDEQLRRRIDGVMLQKQRMLLEAADTIADVIPDEITAAEYTTLGWENDFAGQLSQAAHYLEKSVARSATPMKKVYALNDLALFHFDRDQDVEKGRQVFGQSVEIAKDELRARPDASHRLELANTYRTWADAESRHGQETAGRSLVELAATYAPAAPPPAVVDHPAGDVPRDGDAHPMNAVAARLP